MVPVAILQSRQGGLVSIAYEPGEFKALAHDGNVDAYIVATEDGFSPLGSNRRFLSLELGIPENEIKQLADWSNR